MEQIPSSDQLLVQINTCSAPKCKNHLWRVTYGSQNDVLSKVQKETQTYTCKDYSQNGGFSDVVREIL